MVVLPEPLKIILFCPAPFCIIATASESEPLPCLKVTPFNIELVIISGSEELLYACCKLVVDTPPAAPIVSPNLEAKKNLALVSSVKSVAVLSTVKTPISTALLTKFGNGVNVSV